MEIEIAALTHPGLERRENEDVILVGGELLEGTMDGPRIMTLVESATQLVLVADGMGGHRAGEVASRFTVERLQELLVSAATSRSVLSETLLQVNEEVYTRMEEDEALRGMGTTIVGLWLSATTSLAFNVGDSKCFRVEDADLHQISVDDTPESSGVGAPALPVRRGTITQAIGGEWVRRDIRPHVEEAPFVKGATYLLCSDGLTDMVRPREIRDAIGEDLEGSVERLFDAAMRGGGRDNVSIVMVRGREGPLVKGDPTRVEGPHLA